MLDTIDVLLDRHHGGTLVVSCYANTSVTDPYQSLWSQHLKNEAAAIDRRLPDDRSRDQFAADVDLIRDALSARTARQARGMAIFSSSWRPFFYAIPLGVPVDDCLVIDEEPYLVPLLQAMHRQRRVLAASHPAPLPWRRHAARSTVKRVHEPVIDVAARAAIESELDVQDAARVAELERRLREHDGAAAGAQEVIDALRTGQIEPTGCVVLGPDTGQRAARCRHCGSVFAIDRDRCSSCGWDCDGVNLWQEILLFALRHDLVAYCVDADALAGCGGVAAILSQVEPWAAAGPSARHHHAHVAHE